MKIAILGSGLMGRLLAMRLYQDGFRELSLIEKDEAGISNSPAMIAAGMIAPLSESVMGGELIYKLGEQSLSLWSNYLLRLNGDHLLNKNGTLLITPPQFSGEALHYLSKISFNTKLDNYSKLLDKPQLAMMEPELNVRQAYWLPMEGVLNAPKVMTIIQDYLIDKMNWRTNSLVTQVNSNGLVTINSTQENFDLVFDCRGLGARDVYSELRAVRGEIIRVHAPEVNISRPIRLFNPRHNIYVAPMLNNNYVIGATELEASDYSPISVRSTMDLLNNAYSIHSGFAEARITSSASSCRPTLPDNLPNIKEQNQLISINGLYRHGFLLAPTLTEVLISYVKDGTQQFKQIWS